MASDALGEKTFLGHEVFTGHLASLLVFRLLEVAELYRYAHIGRRKKIYEN